ncbi:Sorting nexin-29 [Pelobates cultripes]|uniref:Sorting nexin-29, partial n=1 Tax=Pelobates cultripes TaxID=61616 RepID=A0AAD1WHY0_PELCU|nr:Sorting nexin-29 [Pelobates cultripes]
MAAVAAKTERGLPRGDRAALQAARGHGEQDAKFVEERRKQLQNYLRHVMNKVIQTLPDFAARPNKESLTQLIPFFTDIQGNGEQVGKSSRSKVASRFPKLSRSHQRESRNLEPQSGDL